MTVMNKESSSISPDPVSPPPSRMLRAAAWALRPLVKLLLHRGVMYPEFAEQLKAVFVDVAAKEFPIPGKRDTDSRISVLTGIYRRDVKRIRQELANDQETDVSIADVKATEEMSLSARVVGLWTGLPEFTDQYGMPKPIARLASKGGQISFEALVKRVNRDTHARTLLDEWVRVGAASIDEHNDVHLHIDAFLSGKSLDEKAFYLQHNAHDHLAALTHNLTGQTPVMLERCVIYRGLSEPSIQILAALARTKGMQVLHQVNQRAIELKEVDVGKMDANYRFNFGTYFYHEHSKNGENDE
ncbi:DUF6502 family protein [Leeia sp. TBRC 13508]|uniref:DUF6502 family protein n=1 Tax=Leeia speluncae TaxID=2884804 RepID=A0ABS8D1C7_9NEIS|nr:DUF6502 family protein [Leeia speluncae]MCB6181992.1 DUF6502 family protein [Leeia speluncae]